MLTPENIALVATVAAYLIATARLFNLARPLYAWLPAKWQPIIIALGAGLPQLAEGLLSSKSKFDVVQTLGAAVVAFLIAAKGVPHDSSNGSSLSGGKTSDQPAQSGALKFSILPRAFRFALLLACGLVLGGCSIFNRATARTAQDIAHDLCVMHFQKEKPALSVEDVARFYCQNLDPWLDSVLGAERLGAAKVKTAPESLP